MSYLSYFSSYYSSLYLKEVEFPKHLIKKLITTPIRQITTNNRLYSR